MNRVIVLLIVLMIMVGSLAPANGITIDTVPIDNPGNPADTRYDPNGFGLVPYSFRMGRTEVTNAQYVEFLNAVAASDQYGLYDSLMSSDTSGGIVRSGSAGNHAYAVKAPALGQGPGGTDYTYENKPVVYVSWYDSIRFANWLHNGQGSGDTENGAYTLLAGTPTPSNGLSINRNAGAKWWVPSEDEWYKAAFYDPNAGIYYDYPAGTDNEPNNNLPANDTGNSANFLAADFTTGNSDYPKTNGGAYTLSASPYGTFDQGGNVSEWNEALVFSSFRGHRGGSWISSSFNLHAVAHSGADPTRGSDIIGFRVATIIPEPSTIALLGLGVLLLGRRMRF